MTTPDTKSNFQVERYKYILGQISSLDQNVHRYMTLFQTLATAIVGGGITIIVAWRKFGIDPKLAEAGIRGLLWLLVFVAAFVVVSLLVGIAAWYDYRVEESRLGNSVIGPGFREPPRLRNFWRWAEVYHTLAVVLAVAAVWIYTQAQILPLVAM